MDSSLIPAAVALAVALVACLTDLSERRIPNRLTYPGLVLTLVAALSIGLMADVDRPVGLEPLARSVVGCLVMGGVYWLAAQSGGVGGGDVKLAAVLGAGLGPLGWWALTLGLTAGFIAGGLAGLAAVVTASAKPTSRLPYAPFMTLGAVIAVAAIWAVGP